MIFLQKIRLLPLLVLVAALSFGIRAGELVTGFSSGGAAYAQHEVDAEPPPMDHKTDHKDDKHAKMDDHGKDMHGEDMMEVDGDEEDEWRDATESEIEYSPVNMELFEDLSERRKGVEAKEKELLMREALLKAAEQELEQKYKELNTLKEEMQELLGQQSEAENARLASLVKIYEGMKAKDAARIFNTLDMDVLLSVLSQMSERKSAPIIAAMSPDRARSVTILLAEQNQLSNLPGANSFR